MPLNQVASVAAPEPKLLTIQPWDKGLLKAVEKAILASDLGLTPSNDGNLIRIPLPPPTKDRGGRRWRSGTRSAREGRWPSGQGGPVRSARSRRPGQFRQDERKQP